MSLLLVKLKLPLSTNAMYEISHEVFLALFVAHAPTAGLSVFDKAKSHVQLLLQSSQGSHGESVCDD